MRSFWLALTLLNCTAINPNEGRFSCTADVDCGTGYQCRPQFLGPSRCFRPSECTDEETCNGVDDNCDGRIDEAFDFTTDRAHCGGCGRACGDGANCLLSVCQESRCDDSFDNDLDGLTDCSDDACLGRSCSAGLDAGGACGRGSPGDAGAVGWCYLPESDCANGLDDDEDGVTDCLDRDCNGQVCMSGTMCFNRQCPGPG
jgi:hypothetical protein